MVSKNRVKQNARPGKMGAKLKNLKIYVLFRKRIELSINLNFVHKIWSMGVKNVRETTKRIEIQCAIPKVEELRSLNMDMYS